MSVLFLDGVNRLPDPLAEAIDRELQLTEEAPMTKLLTRWERKGFWEGLEQARQQNLERGRAEGMSDVVLRQLGKKGIALDATIEAQIRGLDRDSLLDLTEAVLDLQSRADLDAWLARQGRKGA